MTKKKTMMSDKQPILLKVSLQDADQKLAEQISKGKEFLDYVISNNSQFNEVNRDYLLWSEYNIELLKQLFTTSQYSYEYKHRSCITITEDRSFKDIVDDFKKNVDEHIRRLESIKERLKIIPTIKPEEQSNSKLDKKIVTSSNKVFVVYGHDHHACDTVARFLEKLDLEAIILHERPNEGQTIIEKIEKYSDVVYSVVLLIGDDIGAYKSDKGNLQPRARQNVVMELGYFLGKLGRNRVSVLYQDGVELPSDYQGVIYIQFDDSNKWQLALTKELKQAGLKVDKNKVI